MANTDNPFGFRPVGHLLGLPWNGRLEKCYVSASYGTGIFIGDPVDLDPTDGNLETTGMHPTVIATGAGADGQQNFGVCVNIEPNRDDLTQQYHAPSTEGYVYVCTDPFVIYQVQDDGGGTPAATWIGANAAYAAGTGSTVTGKSAYELAAGTTPSANGSLPLIILRLANVENNDLNDYAIWEVVFGMNRFRSAAGEGILGVL